jgi:hypothetical protein
MIDSTAVQMISNDLGTWLSENQMWIIVAVIMLFIKSPGGAVYKLIKRFMGQKNADEFVKDMENEKNNTTPSEKE